MRAYCIRTPELYDLVKTYQIHHHSKTREKNKNKKSQFPFGGYFPDHTIIFRPLETILSCEEKRNTK